MIMISRLNYDLFVPLIRYNLASSRTFHACSFFLIISVIILSHHKLHPQFSAVLHIFAFVCPSSIHRSSTLFLLVIRPKKVRSIKKMFGPMIRIFLVFAAFSITCLGALPISSDQTKQRIAARKAEFRRWLSEHANDQITELDLAKQFKVYENITDHNILMELSLRKQTLKLRKMPAATNGTKLLNWPKSPNHVYDDEFVRRKMFPMAAATYGSAEAKEQCLNNTFRNAKLYRNVELACQGNENEECSGFTAVATNDKAIILAFRGTDTMLQLFKESFQTAIFEMEDGPSGGKVGSYFAHIFAQMIAEGRILDDVAKLISTFPDYELWVTGHSLGGALAAIMSAHIVEAGLIPAERLRLATFGQPRTGDQQWAETMDKNLPHFNYRIVHSRDVVAHVPPLWFKDYEHYMTEIFYNNTMETAEHIVCGPVDESHECADVYWFYTIRDHLHYFGKDVSDWGETGCAQ